MSKSNTVALVTGANRGIGLEIVTQLATLGMKVILTSRNADKGRLAATTLQDSGLPVMFHHLDVTSESDIVNIANFINNEFGKIDILINNAAILVDEKIRGLDVTMDVMRNVLESNLLGPLRLCQEIIPLMKKNNYGRIINISSGMGSFNEMGSGYPSYRISKTALNAMTKILSSELSGTNILINSMCPGWVKTDMGGQEAPRTVAQGADTAVWLAQFPDGGPSGQFFRDRKMIPW